MDAKSRPGAEFDFDKFRLRNFVDRLIELDEVEIHDEAVPLTGLSAIIEATPKAVLFRKAGPEQVEIIVLGISRRVRHQTAIWPLYTALSEQNLRLMWIG